MILSKPLFNSLVEAALYSVAATFLINSYIAGIKYQQKKGIKFWWFRDIVGPLILIALVIQLWIISSNIANYFDIDILLVYLPIKFGLFIPFARLLFDTQLFKDFFRLNENIDDYEYNTSSDPQLDEEKTNSSDYEYDDSSETSPDEDNAYDSDEVKFGRILELKGEVNKLDIHKAYKKKMKEYHPDKVSTMADELKNLALKRTKEINSAYEYFKKKYD